jgi:protein-L-isoaspartate(D-aspartate) O-methyltransferase
MAEGGPAATFHNDSAIRVAQGRERMLALLRRHVRDERVLHAVASVPRELFVPAELRQHAYDDRALPIGSGQTISQPLIVALMLEALDVQPHDVALDVGTGFGYAAAVLAKLARRVVTVERVPALLTRATAIFEEVRVANIACHLSGETLGWPPDAPYDAILVSAGAPHVPRELLDQLGDGGRIVIPVGPQRSQELVRARKTPHGVELTALGPCAFVPLIGAAAWRGAGEA